MKPNEMSNNSPAQTESPLMVGIDVGTTNIKAVVFDRQGGIVATASVPTPTIYPRPTWAYYDPDELWSRSAQALSEAVRQTPNPQRIVSIGVTSIGEAGIPVDAHGEATYASIAWFDKRAIGEAQWLADNIGVDRLFSITGLSLQPIFSLCKILWLRKHEPEAFARTVRWLNAADFIAFRLSGQQATDPSLASRMLMFDLGKLCWADDLIREVGLDPSLLAPILKSGDYLGRVLPEAAALTGLSTNTTVGVGGHDHVCGALAVGVVKPGNMLNSLGTTESRLLPLRQMLTDPQLAHQGYTLGAHTAGGYYVFANSYTSGACIDWFRQAFAQDADFAMLTGEAAAVPPGSLGVAFCPFLRLASSPYDDPKARGAFLGLSTDIKRGALFRAVLEGIALDTRNGVEPLLVHAGLDKLDEIYAIGGGSRNRLLMQIKADVLNHPIHIMRIKEGTAHGAAVLGGKAAGVYASIDDILTSIHHEESLVEPNPDNVPVYEALFTNVYQHIYPSLRSLNHSIFDLQQNFDPQQRMTHAR